MARIKDQNIKSARYYYYKSYLTEAYNSGFNYYDTQYGYVPLEIVKKRSPWNLPGFRGFDPTKIGPGPATARSVIQRIADIWELQPPTGGVTPPQTGPRAKSWWRDNNPLADPIYYRWFVQESSVYVNYFTKPPWGITNNLYVVDSGNYRVMRRDVNNFSLKNKYGSQGSGNDQLALSTNIAIDQNYIYIVDSGNQRIIIRDKTTLAYVTKITHYGTPPVQFDNVIDIAVDDKYLYICDLDNERLIILFKTNFAVYTYLDLQVQDDTLTPLPLAVTASYYYLCVYDANNKRLKIYNRNNLSKRFWVPSRYDKSISFSNVTCMDIDAFYIWVCDSLDDVVYQLATFYPTIVSTIGPGRDVDINIDNPQGVCTSGDYITICDTGHHRLVRLTTQPLDFDQFFGSQGSGDDQFQSPRGLVGDLHHYFTPY